MAGNLDLLTANDRRGEYPPSYYAANTDFPPARPELAGTVETDIAIIGAGYTGLSAALHLAKGGYKVAVLEAQRAGWGASGRNGGQVGSGQRVDQDAIESAYGLDQAKQLWDLAEEAKELVRSLIEDHAINCDPVPGIIEAAHRQRYVGEIHAYADKLARQYDYDKIRNLDREEMRSLIRSEAYHGGAIDEGAFHVQPLAYALGLADAAEKAGASIFETSRVREIRRGRNVELVTCKGSLKASHLIVACNGYLGDLVLGCQPPQ